jgi:hypothetical protein
VTTPETQVNGAIRMRSTRRTGWTRAVLFAAVLATSCAFAATSPTPALAAAANPSGTTTGPGGRAVSVRIEQHRVAVSTQETLTLDVVSRLSRPTDYLEVRLRIRTPSGSLIYQKTEIRSAVAAGVVRIPFARSLATLGARPGRYAIEVRVLATGVDRLQLTDRLLVIRPNRTPTRLVVVTRLTFVPALDPQGRFLLDPTFYTSQRDAVLDLVDLASALPTGSVLPVALQPVMLDEWRRIVGGYETLGPEGVRKVPAGDPRSAPYADALSRLADAVASGRIELLDVPWADPDLAGLQSMRAMADLGKDIRVSAASYRAALEATPAPAGVFAGNEVPASAGAILRGAGLRYVVVHPRSVIVGKKPATPGTWAVADGLRALVTDDALSRELSRGSGQSRTLADALIEPSAIETRTRVAIVDVGPGGRIATSKFAAALRELSSTGLVRLGSVESAVKRRPAGRGALTTKARPGHAAPEGYWEQVALARERAIALDLAADPKDADARAAERDVLLAESRCWAGPDQSWSFADRGRSFAEAAHRRVDRVFRGVTFAVKDITLSSNVGEIPVSVRNTSGKPLHLVIRAQSDGARFPNGATQKKVVGRDETFVTIAVNLGSSLSQRVRISLEADGLQLTTASIAVRASYLDRLVVLAGVLALLAGLLFFIRQRIRRAEAEEEADEVTYGEEDGDEL